MKPSPAYDRNDFANVLKEASEQAMERAGFNRGTLYRAKQVLPSLMEADLRDVSNDPLTSVVSALRAALKNSFGYRTPIQFRQPKPDYRLLVGRQVAVGPFTVLDDEKSLLAANVTVRNEVKAHGGMKPETIEYVFNVNHLAGSRTQSTPWYFKLVETDESEAQRDLCARVDHQMSVQIARSVTTEGLRNPLQGGAPGLGKKA